MQYKFVLYHLPRGLFHALNNLESGQPFLPLDLSYDYHWKKKTISSLIFENKSDSHLTALYIRLHSQQPQGEYVSFDSHP